MTHRQRNIAVEARADLILTDEPSVDAYAAYFEAQMHRSKVRGLLRAVDLWFARAVPPQGIFRWWHARTGHG
ncbi:MAG TPA: hypothetical protein DHU96_03665 [Actinobacteria bacterium]|nr:hypothetical protein [Actinomycetota bacterium]